MDHGAKNAQLPIYGRFNDTALHRWWTYKDNFIQLQLQDSEELDTSYP